NKKATSCKRLTPGARVQYRVIARSTRRWSASRPTRSFIESDRDPNRSRRPIPPPINRQLADNIREWAHLKDQFGHLSNRMLNMNLRCHRISLRAMLMCVAAIAGLCGFGAHLYRRYIEETMLAHDIEARGGQVWREK